jgi:hypothetical protein
MVRSSLIKFDQVFQLTSLLQMLDEQNNLTCVVIGDTGAENSEFDTCFLNLPLSTTSGSQIPMTRGIQTEPSSVNGGSVTREVIGPERLDEDRSDDPSSEQIRRVKLLLRDQNPDLNGLAVVIKSQYDRFSQEIKDTLRWIYHRFGTQEMLHHICIVFAFCSDGSANANADTGAGAGTSAGVNPNRRTNETQFQHCIQQFMMELAGLETSPQIPTFCFDQQFDIGNPQRQQTLVQFHSWLRGRSSLSTDEIETRVFKEYRYEGPINDQYRFAVYEDRILHKLTPCNGDPPRYSSWTTTRTWEEAAGHQTIVIQSVLGEGIARYGPYVPPRLRLAIPGHVCVIWIDAWMVITSFDGEVTQTQPRQVSPKFLPTTVVEGLS